MENYVLQKLADDMQAAQKREKRAARRERAKIRRQSAQEHEIRTFTREFYGGSERAFYSAREARPNRKYRNRYSREQAGTIGLSMHAVRTDAHSVVVCRSRAY